MEVAVKDFLFKKSMSPEFLEESISKEKGERIQTNNYWTLSFHFVNVHT